MSVGTRSNLGTLFLLVAAILAAIWPSHAVSVLLALAAVYSVIGCGQLSGMPASQLVSGAITEQLIRSLPPAAEASIIADATPRAVISLISTTLSLLEADDNLQAKFAQALARYVTNESIHSYIHEALRAAAHSVVTEPKVCDAANTVINAAIKDALKDSELRMILQDTLKEALKDDELYKASLKGIGGALNPFKREQKPEPRSGKTL